MKKSLISILAAGLMAASLAACGGSKPAETTAAPAAAPAGTDDDFAIDLPLGSEK